MDKICDTRGCGSLATKTLSVMGFSYGCRHIWHYCESCYGLAEKAMEQKVSMESKCLKKDPSFYTTKVLVEVEIENQFGPEQAEGMVTNLLKVPAITSLKIVSLHSNYQLHGKPLDEMIEVKVKEPWK